MTVEKYRKNAIILVNIDKQIRICEDTRDEHQIKKRDK